MNDKLVIRFAIYDSLLYAYNELLENEKVDFEIGLTMFYNYDYYKKYKKSNIRFDQDLVLELFDLSLFCIKLNQDTGIMNYQTFFTKNTLEIIDKSIENEFSNLSSKKDYEVLFSFIKVLKSMLVIIATKVAKTEKEFTKMSNHIEAGYNAIKNRFDLDFSKIQQEQNSIRIGYPTIEISLNYYILTFKLRNELIEKRFLFNNTNEKIFDAIFKRVGINKQDRIRWKSISNLKIFLDEILPFTGLGSKREIYAAATNCFVDRKGNELTWENIEGLSGTENNKALIKNIVKSFIKEESRKKL
jgi:hypothetical protein